MDRRQSRHVGYNNRLLALNIGGCYANFKKTRLSLMLRSKRRGWYGDAPAFAKHSASTIRDFGDRADSVLAVKAVTNGS